MKTEKKINLKKTNLSFVREHIIETEKDHFRPGREGRAGKYLDKVLKQAGGSDRNQEISEGLQGMIGENLIDKSDAGELARDLGLSEKLRRFRNRSAMVQEERRKERREKAAKMNSGQSGLATSDKYSGQHSQEEKENSEATKKTKPTSIWQVLGRRK